MALVREPASQSERSGSRSGTSGARNGSSAWLSVGAAAAYPSVKRIASASSTTSTARGGWRPGGAARAASAASSRPPGASRPPAIAAPSASRWVSRASVGVERRVAVGRAHEQPRSVAAASLVIGDLPAQALDLGGAPRVQRACLDRDQQSQRIVERAGVALRPGRREQAPRTVGGFGRQRRRALEERGRRGHPPRAWARPADRSSSQATSSSGPRRRVRAVPGAAVGIRFRIGDLCERAVHVLSFLERRRPVGRRAHQRMTEPHAGTELDQASLDRGRCSLSPDSQALGGAPYERGVADRIRRGEPQEAPRLAGQGVEPSPEALLDSPRERHRAREPEAARQLRRRHAPRQLQ